MSIFLSVDPLAEAQPNKMPYHYVSNNPINRIDPTGMLDTDYYNQKGDHVKYVDDGKTDKKMVLTNSSNSSKVDRAIDKGEVVSVPSNKVISQMDSAYSSTELTGNEYGFVVATDGSSSTTKEGGANMVNLRSQYYELEDLGKISSYDVHTHPNVFDANGNIIEVGLPNPSGTVGAGGSGTKDIGSYGKDGPNDSPSIVLGYNAVKNTTSNQLGGNTQTTTTITKKIGFYNSKGSVGTPMNYNDFKKAVQKINK